MNALEELKAVGFGHFDVEFEPVKVARILETFDGVREIGVEFDGADESDEEDEQEEGEDGDKNPFTRINGAVGGGGVEDENEADATEKDPGDQEQTEGGTRVFDFGFFSGAELVAGFQTAEGAQVVAGEAVEVASELDEAAGGTVGFDGDFLTAGERVGAAGEDFEGGNFGGSEIKGVNFDGPGVLFATEEAVGLVLDERDLVVDGHFQQGGDLAGTKLTGAKVVLG